MTQAAHKKQQWETSASVCDMEMKARVEESPGRVRGKNQGGWGSREHGTCPLEAPGTQGKGLTREWRCGADPEDLFFMCDAVIYN